MPIEQVTGHLNSIVDLDNALMFKAIGTGLS